MKILNYKEMKLNKTLNFLQLLALVLFNPSLILAQQETKITPPSPEAASLAQYAEIPVSTYTGVANIDIPIYTIRARDIELPISISYHASGIKITQEASSVGLGWSLNAGGIISRNIMNQDDFLRGAPYLPQSHLQGTLINQNVNKNRN